MRKRLTDSATRENIIFEFDLRLMKRCFAYTLIILGLVQVATAQTAVPGTNTFANPKAGLPLETKRFLLDADKFVLLSLDPETDFKNKLKNTFRKHRVIGYTNVEQSKDRTNLVDALDSGIANGYGSARCFNPRHGIIATKDDKRMDCLICFECGSLLIYSASITNGFTTSKAPAVVFNGVLRKAGVPLPKN